jgi:hypothetical protein
LETLGLLVFASLFVVSGVRHIQNHAAMSGYTASGFGNCPFAKQLGYLGGWPTGLFLVIFGLGAGILQEPVYFYGLSAFLLVAVALFHRNFWKDPGGFKTLSLAGAAFALAQLVK